MSNAYSSFCDDFFVDMYINTEMELPTDRSNLLYFFERIQKQYPSMGNFNRKDSGEYCLEEDQEAGHYRWVTVQAESLGAGCMNPSELEEAYSLERLTIELAPYMLGVNHLDVQSLDVTFGMDFDYSGNHDEIIADTFFSSTAFSSLLELPKAKAIGFAPTVLIALSEDCRTQARLSIESKTTAYEVRNQRYKSEEAISLYFTIRQYRLPSEKFDLSASFESQYS